MVQEFDDPRPERMLPASPADQLKASVEVDERRTRQAGLNATSLADMFGGSDALIVQVAQVADEIPAWGRRWRLRDQYLRAFMHAESFTMGVIYGLAIRNASFQWTLTGDDAVVEPVQEVLQLSDFGAGWGSLWKKLSIDLHSQDNGAFLEIIRAGSGDTDPVIGLGHLDANRCVRTGDIREPVVYLDLDEREHALKAHQVRMLTEFEAPTRRTRGLQFCAVTRLLRNAQTIRDVQTYFREKIGGRAPRSMHLVSGISAANLDQAKERLAATMDGLGNVNYSDPLILNAMDVEAGVDTATIDFAAVPDTFTFEDQMTWYVTLLALATGQDYQDIAPLASGNLGTSTQSDVLDRKSRGKGPADYMEMVEHQMNFGGILPDGVTFAWEEEDPIAERERADIEKASWEGLEVATRASILSTDQARQIALDRGLISEAVFDMPVPEEAAPAADATPETTVEGDDPLAQRALGTKQDLAGADPEEREDEADALARRMKEGLDARHARVIAELEKALDL